MRWWITVSCLVMASCAEEAKEKSHSSVTKNPDTITQHEIADTLASFARDTSTNTSYTVPQVKRPSGIYQLFLPDDGGTKILHTIAFYPNIFHLEEEYLHKKDSVVVTEGTWTPSQGFIWLYKEQLVRGRYIWKGDTLQYFSPRLNKKFSMTKLTPALANPVWQDMKKGGAIFYGVGTEPFWSVEVKKQDSIILNMPGWGQPLRVKLTAKSKTNKSTTYTAATDSLQVTVSPYFCSDGMSDFIYTNKIIVNFKGLALNGCGVMF